MSANSPMPGSPGWVRPGDVMRVRKFKAKKNALKARMIGSANTLQIVAPSQSRINTSIDPNIKRRNPFKCSPNKKSKFEEDNLAEVTNDVSLFNLLHTVEGTETNKSSTGKSYDFSSFFSKELNHSDNATDCEWTHKLCVDWSLKSRIRFKSQKPLPWKHNFKTSEEASGTTGFVRCLSSTDNNEDRTLDTSANAKFYQCCLLWQHPHLPWLPLFPRDNVKIASQTGLFGTDQKLADSLHADWSESLHSLHQLLRVRQCPYFYMCGPTFTCLFRAAGVAGISQAHALITPTTRGFREAMKNEDIEFEMPFQNPNKTESQELNETDPEDVGLEGGGGVNDEEEEEETKSWLEDLGVETSQFPNLNPNRVKLEREKFKNIDSTPTSLVYVEGMEVQGLVNFLLNSRSCISTTGTLAGVPPTLLAPVAFQGGTLRSLKVKSNILQQDGETQHCMEINGPILPHTIHQLTSLLSSATDTFSVSLNPVVSSISFSKYSHKEVNSIPQAFAQEGLIDCGVDDSIRSLICTPKSEDNSKLPTNYREITCKNHKFTWTDRL